MFSLGAVFLQLTKLLRLENQPQLTKPVDPSLYIHRFADKMGYADETLNAVSSTAMRLVASMKRDWIQTGRRPSGVCGAALYIASHLHGKPRTKREIVNVVHIGEFTLSKRLNEFATTPAGGMNKQEFLEHSEMLERTERLAIERARGEALPEGSIGGCCHVQQDRMCHFRQGLCKECYLTFVGCTGVYEGANPPAFSKNREKETREMLELEAKAKEEKEREEKSKVKAIKGAANTEDTETEESDADDDVESGDDEDGEDGQELGAIQEEEDDRLVTRRRSSRVAKQDEGREEERKRKSGEAASISKPKAGSQASSKSTAKGGRKKSGKKGKEAVPAAQGGDEDSQPVLPVTKDVDTNKINIAFVEAAENAVESFEADLAKVQEADAKKQRKRMPSTAAIISKLSKHAEQEAAVAIGEDREMIVAGRGEFLPLSVAGDFAGGINEAADEPEEELDETLSDISDSEIDQYIAEEGEVKYKEEIWNMMNQDWMEKQEAKKAAQEAQLRAQEEQRLAMERAAAAGVAYKRGRGRPLGSKSKPKMTDNLPMADTPEEAAMRVMDDKKLSAKINYQVLQQLFETEGTPSNLPLFDDGAGGPGNSSVGAASAASGFPSGPLGAPSAVTPSTGGSSDAQMMPAKKKFRKVSVPLSAKRSKAAPPPKFPSGLSGSGANIPAGTIGGARPSVPRHAALTGVALTGNPPPGRLGASQGPNGSSAGTGGPPSGPIPGRLGGLGVLGGLGGIQQFPRPPGASMGGPLEPLGPQRLGGLTKPKGVIAPRTSK